MRNRIFKYFFISLFLLVAGLIYYSQVQTNRITIKSRAEDISQAQTEKTEKVEKSGNIQPVNRELSVPTPKNLPVQPESTAHAKTAVRLNQANDENSQGFNQTKKININTATEAELMTLKGIGNQKAKRIIEYRQAGGVFKEIEDIMKIKGIKRKAFDKIKDFICVADE